jgi:hypothetical protein
MISKTTFVSGAQVTLPYPCRLRFELSAPTPQSTFRRQDPQKSATRDHQTRLSGQMVRKLPRDFRHLPLGTQKQPKKIRQKIRSDQASPIKPKLRVVKTTYQIRLGPIRDPRIARFRGPPHRPARDRVQNLRSHPSINMWGQCTCYSQKPYQCKIHSATACWRSLGTKATIRYQPSIYRAPPSHP